MWIEGVGVVTVHDRGGVIKGQRAEIFFKTHDKALQWGVQELKVSIWKEASLAE
jgi:3D (Asp-Asp-Asp) domain-containing protein